MRRGRRESLCEVLLGECLPADALASLLPGEMRCGNAISEFPTLYTLTVTKSIVSPVTVTESKYAVSRSSSVGTSSSTKTTLNSPLFRYSWNEDLNVSRSTALS